MFLIGTHDNMVVNIYLQLWVQPAPNRETCGYNMSFSSLLHAVCPWRIWPNLHKTLLLLLMFHAGLFSTQLILYAAWQPALTLMQTAVQLFNTNSSRNKNLPLNPTPSILPLSLSCSLSISPSLYGAGRRVINLFNNNLPTYHCKKINNKKIH